MILQGRLASRLSVVALVCAALATTTGCKSKKSKPMLGDEANGPKQIHKVDMGEGAEGGEGGSGSEWSSEGGGEGANADGGRYGTAEAGSASDSLPEGHAIPELTNIFFAFDQSELTDEAKATLKKNGEYLKSNTGMKVILRGHTDSEGTEEYNLALGSARAQIAREFLIGEGVDAGRLETVSFGEGLPAVEGESADAQSKNRRVEFFVYE